MSDWNIDYHLRHLREASGCDWVRDYSGADAQKLFAELERSRRKRDRYVAYEMAGRRAALVGAVMFMLGIVAAVYSTMNHIDWGTVGAALILPGVFLPVLGWIGAFLLRFNVIDGLDDETCRREAAYNEALTKTMGAE